MFKQYEQIETNALLGSIIIKQSMKVKKEAST